MTLHVKAFDSAGISASEDTLDVVERATASSTAGGWILAAVVATATAGGTVYAPALNARSFDAGGLSGSAAVHVVVSDEATATAGGWVLSVEGLSADASGRVAETTTLIGPTASGWVAGRTSRVLSFDVDGPSAEAVLTLNERVGCQAAASGWVTGTFYESSTAGGWLADGIQHVASATAGGYAQSTRSAIATAGGLVVSQAVTLHVVSFDGGGASAEDTVTVFPVVACSSTAGGWIQARPTESVTAGGQVAQGGALWVRAFDASGISVSSHIHVLEFSTQIEARAGGYVAAVTEIGVTAGGEVYAIHITADASGTVFDTPIIEATAGGEVFVQGPLTLRFEATLDRGIATTIRTVNIADVTSKAIVSTVGGTTLEVKAVQITAGGHVSGAFDTSATASGEVSNHRQIVQDAGGWVIEASTAIATAGGWVSSGGSISATVGGEVGGATGFAPSRFKVWNGSAWV